MLLSVHRCATGVAVSLSVFGTMAFAGGDSTNTIGLIEKGDHCSPGYNLFAPLNGTQTYLIDNDGMMVNSWLDTDPAGNAMYMLPNGNLLRCSDNGPQEGSVLAAGGDGGCIRIFGWDNSLLWDFCYNTPEYRLHHDIEPLPNGNVLAIAWEYKSYEESVAAGRDPLLIDTDGSNSVWPLHIIEIEPDGATGGNIVWSWHLWDHLVQDFDATKDNFGVVADNPGKVDLNYVRDDRGDWIHANSIDYNAERDEILISTPFLNELWVIRHDTTTEEAAGPAGDLVYRWGNPQVYDRGTADDQTLFFNHDARWVEDGYPNAGNITVFNNGNGRPAGPYSTIDMFTPALDKAGNYQSPGADAFGPVSGEILFNSELSECFYSSGLSGVEMQPNGNVLVCKGRGSGSVCTRGGEFYEVTPSGEITWLYVNPVTTAGPLTQGDDAAGQLAFRCSRYPDGFPGFKGQDMSPKGPLELSDCEFDLNGDGIVDGADMGLLLSSWGSPYDGADLGQLLSSWGLCP